MKVTLITLFPDFFTSPLSSSVIGRAVTEGSLEVELIDPRNFAPQPHRSVDDTPYGGGAGMVLKVDVLHRAIQEARKGNSGPVMMLTPRGKRLEQKILQGWSQGNLILLCGHYEGFDERIHAYVDGEVSIGDFVLTGGEPAALVILDGAARLCSGVLGNPESAREESFSANRLDYPVYTRPRVYEGQRVPEVLCSGNNAKIEGWRTLQSLLLTLRHRPDLLEGEQPPAEKELLTRLARQEGR